MKAQEEELKSLRAERASLAAKLAGIEKAVAQLTTESKSAKLEVKSGAIRKPLTTASVKY